MRSVGATQLAEHLPAHPEQQQAARQQQSDDRQQLQRDGAQSDADHRRAQNAEQDGWALLLRAQTGNRHPDHDRIVAGQCDVDHDDLRQGGEVGGQCNLVQAGSPLSATGATV